MRYKGRFIIYKFNPSKRARFGLKIYKLYDAHNGFCCNFKIYTGQGKIHPNDGALQNVMELMKSIVNKGHCSLIPLIVKFGARKDISLHL